MIQPISQFVAIRRLKKYGTMDRQVEPFDLQLNLNFSAADLACEKIFSP